MHGQTFHVWNDAWMARPDLGQLPSKWDGWQAVDATPQELSGGKWQMGPAPVRAVFDGVGSLSYDCEFVIAEVIPPPSPPPSPPRTACPCDAVPPCDAVLSWNAVLL